MADYGGIGVIYITDDSSSESKCDQNTENVEPAPLQTEQLDEFCEGLLVETNEGIFLSNNDQTVLVDPNAFSLPPTLDQKDVVANQQYFDEFNKEKEMAAAADNLFYYQEDENEDWAIDEGDCLVEEPPYIECSIGETLITNPLPDFPLEDSSFHSMNSDNSMIKHLAEMELKRSGLSSSGSGKRKNLGGDADTASSDQAGHKRPKF